MSISSTQETFYHILLSYMTHFICKIRDIIFISPFNLMNFNALATTKQKYDISNFLTINILLVTLCDLFCLVVSNLNLTDKFVFDINYDI